MGNEGAQSGPAIRAAGAIDGVGHDRRFGATAALTSNAPIMSSATNPRTVRIEYGDLNLATQKGKDVLSQRIRQAVNIVCAEPEPSPRVLDMWSEYRRCMQNATDSAWSQIRWPPGQVKEAAAMPLQQP
jgi:UrcA family protein